MSVRKPSKSSTSQAISALKQSWKLEKLYSILEAWVKDDMVVLLKCKHEPTEEEKQGVLYCRYHKRSGHHTMDCYALRNIFHEKMAKGDLVIKNGKRTDQRIHKHKAIWKGRPVTIEATRMPNDKAEFHYAEATLYQEFEPKGENKILHFNATVLERGKEDDGEVVEPERHPKIKRITKHDGKVVCEF
nr:hypothetical protein CFP56_17151 [Quercus suber]